MVKTKTLGTQRVTFGVLSLMDTHLGDLTMELLNIGELTLLACHVGDLSHNARHKWRVFLSYLAWQVRNLPFRPIPISYLTYHSNTFKTQV